MRTRSCNFWVSSRRSSGVPELMVMPNATFMHGLLYEWTLFPLSWRERVLTGVRGFFIQFFDQLDGTPERRETCAEAVALRIDPQGRDASVAPGTHTLADHGFRP